MLSLAAEDPLLPSMVGRCGAAGATCRRATGALGSLLAVPSDSHTERFAGLPRRVLPGGLTLVEARTSKARRRGLSRLEELPADHALLIPRCPSVHTFGMRFALDLIWLGKGGTVVRVDRAVPPRRMRLCVRARSVVETVAGNADAFLAAGL
jgi:uncharacterized membrane protein (UPF0127 family)